MVYKQRKPLRFPYNKKLTEVAKQLRKSSTREERLLWRYLRKLPVRIHRQYPLLNFIVDFYIPSRKIIIEIDGGQHFSETGMTYDIRRTNALEALGLKIVRFNNHDVKNNTEAVCAQIWRLVQ